MRQGAECDVGRVQRGKFRLRSIGIYRNLLLFMGEIEVGSLSSISMNTPCTLFETSHRFNDISADDMKYGDMDERQLRALGLDDISARVDPYQLIQYDYPKPENYQQFENGFFSWPVKGRKISRHECAHILFEEMKSLPGMFSFWGEYKHLIGEMIDHFRDGGGVPYSSSSLNLAYKQLIQEVGYKSPISIIKGNMNQEYGRQVNLNKNPGLLERLKRDMSHSMLPKFNRSKDRINGLGITVHDINSQRIKLINAKKYAMGWEAWIHFEAQDHFGLDVVDINNSLYRNFRFFRIWFFLQRHRDFAFKPFFTNFNADVMVKG